MPLDPTLIQNAMANWQQPEDPLTRFAKIQALKNGIQQSQVNQQQLQSGALDLQQKQQAAQDAQTFRDVLRQTGGDYTKAAPLLAGRISPAMQMQFQKQLEDHAKALADKDKTDLENMKSRNEMVGNSLEKRYCGRAVRPAPGALCAGAHGRDCEQDRDAGRASGTVSRR